MRLPLLPQFRATGASSHRAWPEDHAPSHCLPLRWLVLTLCAAATAGGCAWASHGTLASQFSAVVTLSLLNLALMAWVALDRHFDDLKMPHLLITALTLGLIGMAAQPLLEDDHFRYLWDGYITATTGQPFAHAPSHYFGNAAVPASMQAVLNGINHPDIPTIYGPALQVLFALCYSIAPAALWPLKGVLLAAMVATLLLLRIAGVPARGLMLFILHPLLLKESAITAHPDLLLGLALLAAVLAWQRGFGGTAAALAGIAVGMKFSALAALPFFCVTRNGRWSARGSMVMALTLGILYAPQRLTLSGTEGRALSAFSNQWTFNPLLFKLTAELLPDATARVMVAILFAATWLVLAWRWLRRLRRMHRPSVATPNEALPMPPLVAVIIAMLLLAPVVNPWYWLWALPLAVLSFSGIAWTAATLSLLSYAHVAQSVWSGSSLITYAVPPWATALQMAGIVVACLLASLQLRRSRG